MDISDFNKIYSNEIIGSLQLNEDNWCLQNGYFLKFKINAEEFVVFNIESLFSVNSTIKVKEYHLFANLDNRKFIYIINYSLINYNLIDFSNSLGVGIIITGLLTKKSKLIKLKNFIVFSLTIKVFGFTKIILVKDWRLYDLKIGSRYRFTNCFLLSNNVFEFGGSKVENLDGDDDIILESKSTELIVQRVLDFELGLIKCNDDCYLIIDNRLDLINWIFGSETKILLFDSEPIELSNNQNKVKLFNIDLFTNYKITKLVLQGYKKPKYYLETSYQTNLQWVYKAWLLKVKLLEIGLNWAFLAIISFCNIQYFQSKLDLTIEDLIPINSAKDIRNILLILNPNTSASLSNQYVLLKLVLNHNLCGLSWLDSNTRMPANVKFKGAPIDNNLRLWINFWYIVPYHLFNHPTVDLKDCLKLDMNDALLLKNFSYKDFEVDHTCKIGSDNSSETSFNSNLNTPGPIVDSSIDCYSRSNDKKRPSANSCTLSFQILNRYPTAYVTIFECISTAKLKMFYLVLNKYRSTELDLFNSRYFQLKNYEVIYDNYLTMNSNSTLESICPKMISFDTITGRIINLTWGSHNLITYEDSRIFTTNFNLTIETLGKSIIKLNCSYLLLQKVIKFEDLKHLSMDKVKLKDFYYEFTSVKLNIAHFKPLKSIAICYKLLELIESV